MEPYSQSGDVAASHSPDKAHSGPDKVRVEEVNELVGVVGHTLPRQLPVCRGENVILPEDSPSDISVLDVEVEQNMNEFEVQKSIKSGEAVNQPLSYGQREVSYPVVGMDVCSQNSLYPGVICAQPPVVSACPDLSVVNEVSEVSHNPSSRSTLPMMEEARSDSPVLRTAVEARTKLENAINEARSQTRSPSSVFRPVEFESTPMEIASAHFEKWSTKVRMYTFCLDDFGCGPVISIDTRSQGSPDRGVWSAAWRGSVPR